MRVTLVIPSLSAGGAERVLSLMANYWAQKGWTVSVLTLDDGSEPPFYPLHSGLVLEHLSLAGASGNALEGLLNNLRRMVVLRRTIRRTPPNVVVSFMDRTSVLAILATTAMKLPVIAYGQNDPQGQPVGLVWDRLRRWAYPRAASLVMQTERVRSFFPPALQRLSRVIPNPVTLPTDGDMARPATATDGNKLIIAMGRLIDLKGFDLLLRAFAKVASNHPEWSLEIWGEGPLRLELEALVDELGLCGRVRLPGRTKRPFEKMRRADLFVLSSRSEGFPNVLCEAMASGLPVLSFDCPYGPREIIRDGVDGVLVPAGDADALAAAMSSLMGDEVVRRRLASHAPDVLTRFGLETVMGMWEDLIREIAK